jgi:hypothetical protein
MNTLKNILVLLGISYVAKLGIDYISSSVSSKIELSYGAPSFDFSALLGPIPKIKITLPVVVQNNNSVGLNVTSFVGDIYYGSVKLSSVTIPAPAQILANSQGFITLVFNVEAISVINDIVSSMNNTGAYSTLVNVIKLKGVLETNVYRIPVNTNISLV